VVEHDLTGLSAQLTSGWTRAPGKSHTRRFLPGFELLLPALCSLRVGRAAATLRLPIEISNSFLVLLPVSIASSPDFVRVALSVPTRLLCDLVGILLPPCLDHCVVARHRPPP